MTETLEMKTFLILVNTSAYLTYICPCRSAIFKAGSVPLLAKLIRLDKEEFLVPVVGLAQECAVEVISKCGRLVCWHFTA